VTGCSSSPTLIEFKEDPIEIKAEGPLDKCIWPKLQETELDDNTIIYMNAEGLKAQRSCQVTEQGNYEIAKDNAKSVDNAVNAFNALIKKSEIHHQHAQNELDRVEDERKSKAMEVLTYQGLLALVLIAIAL